MFPGDDRTLRRALAIVAAMALILFIGLFVGYRWGAEAASSDNALRPSSNASGPVR